MIVVSNNDAQQNQQQMLGFLLRLYRENFSAVHMLPFGLSSFCIAFFFQLISDFTFQICMQSTRNQAYCASGRWHFSKFIIICIIEFSAVFFFSFSLCISTFQNLLQMCTDEWNWNATLKHGIPQSTTIKHLDIKTQDEMTLYGFESSRKVNNAINANFFLEIFIDAHYHCNWAKSVLNIVSRTWSFFFKRAQ